MSAGPALARLAHAFPRQAVPEETIRLYAQDLAEVPEGLLIQAVVVLTHTAQWFPTLAEIRECCAEIALDLPTEVDALAEIEEKQKWLRSELRDPSANPASHPLVDEVVRHVGGYQAFRGSEEPTVLRGQFLRLYRETRAAAILQAQTNATIVPLRELV